MEKKLLFLNVYIQKYMFTWDVRDQLVKQLDFIQPVPHRREFESRQGI
jgi:hypothetical protein